MGRRLCAHARIARAPRVTGRAPWAREIDTPPRLANVRRAANEWLPAQAARSDEA